MNIKGLFKIKKVFGGIILLIALTMVNSTYVSGMDRGVNGSNIDSSRINNSHSEGTYKIDFKSSQFTFYQEKGYDRIKAEGFIISGIPGAPEIPTALLNYIIPPNAKVKSLIVSKSVIEQVPGTFSIFPIQQPVMYEKIPSWESPNESIYNSDVDYPAELVKIVNEGIWDGARIVTVEASPFWYRSKSKQLSFVSQIAFKLEFSQTSLPEVRAEVRGEYEQNMYDVGIRNLVVNDYEIQEYYKTPSLVTEVQLNSSPPFPTAPAVIITHREFADAFQPYADWLTEQGIRAAIIPTDLIYLYFKGRDEAEKVRNYIKYDYKHAGGTFFILGGMDSCTSLPFPYKVPARWCWLPDLLARHIIVTDYYYCSLDGDWNADGDDMWGEMEDEVDQFPEVYVGRVPARDVRGVKNWCYKALNYEKSPGNPGALTKVKWIHQTSWFMGLAIEQFPDHFSHVINTDPTAYEAFNALNAQYGFINGQTHGSILSFFTNREDPPHEIYYYKELPPTLDNWKAGLNWLTNTNKGFIYYSVGCNTGQFDNPTLPCVAECLTTRYRDYKTLIPVGACASIEHTRYSISSAWPPHDDYSHRLQKLFYIFLFTKEHIISGLHDIFSSYFSRLGVPVALAKTKVPWNNVDYRWVAYGTNLFGSPTTDAWTNIPRSLQVSHPLKIYTGQQTQFEVKVQDAATEPSKPVPFAKVCLYHEDIYKVGRTGLNGKASFQIVSERSGTLKVTVTRVHNYSDSYIQYLPSQTTCAVLNIPI